MVNMKKISPIIVLIICLSLTFIFAAHVITNDISIIPEDVNSIVRIVVNNTDTLEAANISVVNITLPSNFIFATLSNSTTAGTHTFSNTSNVLSWVNDGLVMNITNQSFVFNVTMATAGTYNFSVYTWNSTTLSSSNVSITINDTTFPTVSLVSIVSGGNYSGTFTLNATITEDTPSKVYFNVTNSSGGQNGTFTASRVGTSSSWNATINTSHYIDGVYNISVWVNDSNNQINNSVVAINLRIDNTAPVITYFYCTPTSVYPSDTVTCTCTTLTDAGSGISSTAFTVNPSTATLGTSTQTCTSTDRVGNSISATTTFDVVSRPSGDPSSSSSSSTQTWSNTYITTDTQFQTGYSKTLNAKERVKVKVVNTDHYIGVKSITSTSAVIEIASDPIEITLDIGEDAKADVNDDGVYDIYVVLNNIVDGKAEITIQKISEEVAQGEEAVTTTGEITTPQEETPAESIKSKTWILVVVIVLVLIIIGAGYKIKKK
jgi:hypothetical protein